MARKPTYEELEQRIKVLEEESVKGRRTEETTQRERQRLYEVLETLSSYVVLLAPDYHVPFANRFFRERFGESHGKRCFEYLFNRTEACGNCETYTVMKTHAPHRWEWTGPDGRIYDISDFPFTDTDGSSLILEMGIDITERKKAEETLRRERDFTSAVLDNTGGLVVVLEREGRITRFNRACEAVTGYAAQEVSGRVFWEFLVPPEELPGVKEQWDALIAGDFPNQHENHWVAKDGSRHLIAWSNTAIITLEGEVDYIIGTGLDITERKIREERIARLTRLYVVLSQVNEMIVRTRDERLLYEGVCRIVAEEGEFPLVWVGQLKGRQVAPSAWHGRAAVYLKEIKVEVDGELGNGPTGTCIREDRSVVNDDFDVNPATAPWRQPALRHGFRASAAFPVHRQGQVVSTLTLYATEPGVFDAEQVALLEALCADISYALDAMHKERLRAKAENAVQQRTSELQQLTESLEHRVQERTADLAAANETLRYLSARLLSAEEEERKRVAAEIHDTIGSCLSAVKFKVESAVQQIGETSPGTIESLKTIIPVVKESIDECRRIQMDLRPAMLDDLGLLPTLSWFCRRFQTIYSGIRIEEEIAIQEDDIPQMLKIVVFRVTQEAMNNIAKHSKADLVRFSLRKWDDRMELVLQDNGRGFSLEKINSQRATLKGLGLTSMRERAELSGGTFDIESLEGKGTIISASWPFCKKG
jgi:PAS domain S-box-containing protein